MMNPSSCLKVTVNGERYVISGVYKEGVRKNLLCALAKSTSNDETFQQLKDGGFVAKRYECVSDELSRSTSDEKLLKSPLKGGLRVTAGDYESFKILNNKNNLEKKNGRWGYGRGENGGGFKSSIKSNTGSTREEKHSRRKYKIRRCRFDITNTTDNKKPDKFKHITSNNYKKRDENLNYELSRERRKHKYSQILVHRSTTNEYFNTTLDSLSSASYIETRLDKYRERCYCFPDNVINICYEPNDALFQQNITLPNNCNKKQSKLFIKPSNTWFKENIKVYYIDSGISCYNDNNALSYNDKVENNYSNINTSVNPINRRDGQNMNEVTATCITIDENDDDADNDSGLPSPEYDSSESTDVHPIRLKRTIPNKLREKTEDMVSVVDDVINVAIKNTCSETKHDEREVIDENINKSSSSPSSERNGIGHCNEHSLSSNKIVNNNIKTKRENGVATLKPGKLTNYNEDVFYLQRRSKSLGDLLFNSRGESKRGENTKSEEFPYDINNVLGGETDEEKVRYILKNLTSDKIINMGVLNPASMTASVPTKPTKIKKEKKSEKKKINKMDISEPQLLSPTQFRRYGSLKNVQTAAALQQKNGVANGVITLLQQKNINLLDIGRSDTLPTTVKESKEVESRKEKEKFYNKKLIDLRFAKKLSKVSGKQDLSTKPKKSEKITKDITDKLNGTKEEKTSKEKHKINEINETLSKSKKDWKSHKLREEGQILNNTSEPTSEPTSENPLTITTSIRSPLVTTTTSIRNQSKDTCSFNFNNSRNCADPDIKLKKELDIIDIEKQIIELNKLKVQQKTTECSSDKYICQNIENGDLSPFHEVNNMVSNMVATCCDSNDEEDDDDICNFKNTDNDDAIDTTSDYSSLNENIKLESIEDVADDVERNELLALYTQEEAHINELIEKIIDANLLIEALAEELAILKIEDESCDTTDDLIAEEERVYVEIDSVRGLLQGVIDLCGYQRKEMSDNLSLLDKLDTKVRTKKAGYEILRSGEWRTNSKKAPRPLLKYSQEKKALNCMQPQSLVPSNGSNV